MKKFALIISLIFILSSLQFAQDIPNAGFESWIDENTPQSWNTNNLPSAWITVSRSTTAYDGSYAIQMKIAESSGFPIPPVLTSTFPVSQAYTAIHGYYQFHPVGPDMIFSIYAYYFYENKLNYGGSIDLDAEALTYTSFSFDLNTDNSDTPDSIWIQFEIAGSSVSNYGIGTYALIDQLVFDQATEVKSIIQVPNGYSLNQNYPNPFNPLTTIEYSIPKTSHVDLRVFDVLGNEVATLVNEYRPIGIYEVEFEATSLSSGVYFYKLQAGEYVGTKKMILMR